MKIGIVCYPTFGGSGVIATELGMALSSKGHEIHFITYNRPVRLDMLSSNIKFHEVFVEEYPLFHFQPYELALSTKLVEVIAENDIEILHVHYAIPHAYAAYMAKQMLKEKGIDIKVVTTLHGTDITLVGSHPIYKAAVEFSINNSDVVTTVSQSLKKDTERLFNIRKPIKVVYNFIDFNKYIKFQNEPCKRHVLAEDNEVVVTHISNFRPVKRILDVVKIFNIIQKELKAKLILVGDGPDRAQAEKMIKELGIDDKVIFLGNITEVYTILCFSDLFLLPSETESFGFAALEAMAARTPVISTNTGGIPEVNISEETGFLSSIGNVEEMGMNAIRILKDKEILSMFKEQSYFKSLEFSMEKIVPKYENIYTNLLESVL